MQRSRGVPTYSTSISQGKGEGTISQDLAPRSSLASIAWKAYSYESPSHTSSSSAVATRQLSILRVSLTCMGHSYYMKSTILSS